VVITTVVNTKLVNINVVTTAVVITTLAEYKVVNNTMVTVAVAGSMFTCTLCVCVCHSPSS